jgi:hypothetical protein
LVGVPLIIGGGERGVVASCSYETRYFGVRSAMPIKMALRLCPEAKVIKGDMEMYSNMSRTVTEIIQEKVPVLEKASIDEFYMDLSGMDKFFGCYQWTTEIAESVTKNTGLPISFALSTNKTVSKIGTGESKPTGKLEINEQQVKPFLNPLSIKKIPMVGNVTFQLLSRIGIRNIGTLSEMPIEVLQQLIGKNGSELWKKANGNYVGIKWMKPYKFDIYEYLKAGENTIELNITNEWTNRLIGDQRFPDTSGHSLKSKRMPDWYINNEPMPETQRLTFDIGQFYSSEDSLLPAGLRGPVCLILNSVK